MPTRKVPVRGRFYEEFSVGDLYRHHWGRTLTEGECSIFTTWTMNANPLYFNRALARAEGHPATPVNPLFAMNVVFGLSVEDLSEQAIAHLGYWKMRFLRPIYPGETLFSESEVLEKRESQSSPDRGIVHVRTRGLDEEGKTVLEYERKILVKKKSHHGGGASFAGDGRSAKARIKGGSSR